MSQNNLLFTPFELPCGQVLKNRVVKAALTERLSKSDMLPNERHRRLYEHWAQNDAGLLISGNILVDKRYLESTGNIVVEKNTPEAPFKEWTSAITSYGNHFWAQISHAGRQSSIFSTRKPVSPSDVQLKKMGLFAKPTPLTEAGIKDVIDRFVHTAAFCKKVGFSGVQIHAAHGYLISQFLSPHINKRNDKWGGSLENRARLLCEIVKNIRKSVGDSFPVSIKLNSADFQKGGFSEDDAIAVIKMMEPYKLDLIEISGGTYERSAMFGIGLKESTQKREAYFIDFAEKIRSQTSIPLMVTGGFRSASFCNSVLEANALDVVGFGRPFLISDTFPKEFRKNQNAKISNPKLKILDSNNADAAEAGHYDLQIKRLSKGLGLKDNYSAVKLATHIGWVEMKKGFMNRFG